MSSDYERAYFERGMFAAYAWMVTRKRGGQLSDVVVDHAWDRRDEGMGPTECLPVLPIGEQWQPIDTAPTDGSTVMLAFSGQVEAGYYDDGTDCDGKVVEQPGWFWFDQHETGPCLPLYWQPYPAAPNFTPSPEIAA